VKAAEDLIDEPALRMFDAPTSQLLGDRIQVFDAAI
jgi:hypothetical protein